MRTELGDTLQNDVEQFNTQVRNHICLLHFECLALCLLFFNNAEVSLKLGSANETIVAISQIYQSRNQNEGLESYIEDGFNSFSVFAIIGSVGGWVDDLKSFSMWVENDPHVM